MWCVMYLYLISNFLGNVIWIWVMSFWAVVWWST